MLLQGAVDIFVQVIKRSCKGKGNGSGLAGDSAATYRYFYIILAVLFRNSKGEKGDVVFRFGFKILIDRLSVNVKFSGTRFNIKAGCGSFCSRVVVLFGA